MKVLILHMRFHPDLTGTGPLVTDLATDLVAMGNQVTVVTSMPHYGGKVLAARTRRSGSRAASLLALGCRGQSSGTSLAIHRP